MVVNLLSFKKSLKFYEILFKNKSERKMALASSLGVFFSILPIPWGQGLFFLWLISLVFQLNISAVLLGFLIPYIFPFLSQFGSGIAPKIWGMDPLRSCFISGFVYFLLLYPFFRWLYHLPYVKNQKISKPFVFYDQSHRRWTFVKKGALLLLTIIMVVGGFCGISLYKTSLPVDVQPIQEKTLVHGISSNSQSNPMNWLTGENTGVMKEVYAFYVSWDEKSEQSLKNNIQSIQVLIPDWYTLTKDFKIKGQNKEEIDRMASANQVKVMPLINNIVDGEWNKELVHQLLIQPKAQDKLIVDLLTEIKKHSYYGINIDFEGLNPQDQILYTLFVQKLTSKFHEEGLQVSLDVPPLDSAGSAFDYKSLATMADQIMVMVYDEHFVGGESGPIASEKFVTDSISSLKSVCGDKFVAALGQYGYDWTEDKKKPATEMTFTSVMALANKKNLHINWDTGNRNPSLQYREGNDLHTLWFLDGATFYNQLNLILNSGIKSVAIWRLGAEDSSIWKVLKDEKKDALATFDSLNLVNQKGSGEILKFTSEATQGKREVTFDEKGRVVTESYLSFPTPYEVNRFGKTNKKEIVLTFDDGPDPKYTSKVLEILAKYKVPATFFLIGENAEKNPDLVREIYQNGYEIGNHTYDHPNISTLSGFMTKVELNATERIIQEITGHSTLLFRPPYVADAQPSTPEELLPIIRAQNIGYTMVGELIDPQDWSKPSSNEIVRRVNQQLKGGNVILLHDGGGDRSNTLQALPKIIETLKGQGYTFVTVSHLLGKSRDTLMPPVGTGDSTYMYYNKIAFSFFSGFKIFITYLFYIMIVLGVFRLLFLIYYSYKQKRLKKKEKHEKTETYNPLVSVIVAAYNEEKVICNTLNSILKSDYKNFEIIIVDDGSTDYTVKVIKENFGSNPRTLLITKDNGGKSSAINRGLIEARGEIIVSLDADTLISQNAISVLIPHFTDPSVAAVSGNIKVGNIGNLWTVWQHIEYVTGFNLERRAFSMFNCITVVPGAIGAWRKDAITQCGLYKEDTLAEDTDLTLKLLQEGYQVKFEENAYAYTEVPSEMKGLIKQRFRWTYGTLQCLWKYRRQLFHPEKKPLGFMALPNMWLFQFIFQSLSPLADLYFIFSLFSDHPGKVILYYTIFFLVDLFASFYAFRLEKEKIQPLTWIFLQRILYRQVMAFVVLKAILFAIKGMAVGWNKLKRQGNVEISLAEKQ